MLSGSETDKDNYRLEEAQENEYIYEDSYDDKMEYVEVDNSQNNTQIKKRLYLENDDYLGESEMETESKNKNIINDKNQKNKKRISSRKPASKRPVEQVQETLDIEPLDTNKKSSNENQSLNLNEIDDPW